MTDAKLNVMFDMVKWLFEKKSVHSHDTLTLSIDKKLREAERKQKEYDAI